MDQPDTDDADRFGREIAAHTVADIKALALRLATVETKQTKLRLLPARAHRAITAAAMGRHADGMPEAEALAWRDRALAGYTAAMQVEMASLESAG